MGIKERENLSLRAVFHQGEDYPHLSFTYAQACGHFWGKFWTGLCWQVILTGGRLNALMNHNIKAIDYAPYSFGFRFNR